MNTSIHEIIESNLHSHMQGTTGLLEFSEVLDYGVLPAGKLFRPKLAYACFRDSLTTREVSKEDLGPQSHIGLIASALEIHHAYTLIHDDLPCMDDDDFRRGRESTHKKFGQWQAVLAGDALLHHSHKLIGLCRHENHYTLRSIFNWALGAKGLILGQVFDLGGLINADFPSLLRTHELKTGRLIQTSLLAGAWAAQSSSNSNLMYRDIKNLMRLGSKIGIVFQLLDDLSELTEELSEHEKEVNPFLSFSSPSFTALIDGIERIKAHQGHEINLVLADYFKKMKSIISTDLALENSKINQQISDQQSIERVKEVCSLL